MERRRVGFQIHIRAAIAQLHFSFGADSQHFVGQAPLVLARESKKRSGNVRYSALLCSACGFRSARKSVYNLTQQQSQEPELYKRGEPKRAPAIRLTISLPHTLLRGAYPRCPLRAMRVTDRDFSTYDSA